MRQLIALVCIVLACSSFVYFKMMVPNTACVMIIVAALWKVTIDWIESKTRR